MDSNHLKTEDFQRSYMTSKIEMSFILVQGNPYSIHCQVKVPLKLKKFVTETYILRRD